MEFSMDIIALLVAIGAWLWPETSFKKSYAKQLITNQLHDRFDRLELTLARAQ